MDESRQAAELGPVTGYGVQAVIKLWPSWLRTAAAIWSWAAVGQQSCRLLEV